MSLVTSQSNGNRILYWDVCRALCAFWIVGVWHLLNYTSVSIRNAATLAVTDGILGTFIFISGYFMGSHKISTRSDVFQFIKNRLIRFFPLFVISCSLFYFAPSIMNGYVISSFKQYILTLTGLSCIITPAPSTLWFMSMLFLFYILTPWILLSRGGGRLATSVVIYFIMICLDLLIGIDSRVLLWFPMYILGIFVRDFTAHQSQQQNHPIVGIACLLLFIGIVVSTGEMQISGLMSEWAEILTEFSHSFCFVIIMVEVCKVLSQYKILQKILLPVSCCSMTAYLFHREIYGLLYKIFGKFNVFEAVFSVGLVFALSYIIQRGYDYLAKHRIS